MWAAVTLLSGQELPLPAAATGETGSCACNFGVCSDGTRRKGQERGGRASPLLKPGSVPATAA